MHSVAAISLVVPPFSFVAMLDVRQYKLLYVCFLASHRGKPIISETGLLSICIAFVAGLTLPSIIVCHTLSFYTLGTFLRGLATLVRGSVLASE